MPTPDPAAYASRLVLTGCCVLLCRPSSFFYYLWCIIAVHHAIKFFDDLIACGNRDAIRERHARLESLMTVIRQRMNDSEKAQCVEKGRDI